ncbi:MAG TPA: VOC family protein [Fimbriimonadaceae bacterium]|nr:VOC family protein [Fimbriimonadaceae bacterium]
MSDFATNVGNTFCWHELYCANAEEGVKFYTEAFGWGTESMDMGPMGTYPMLNANGMSVAGVFGTAAHADMADVPPHWAIYIAVDDVDAKLAHCQSLGAMLLVGPMDVPTVGRMALMKDPVGATFWLFKGQSE